MSAILPANQRFWRHLRRQFLNFPNFDFLFLGGVDMQKDYIAGGQGGQEPERDWAVDQQHQRAP